MISSVLAAGFEVIETAAPYAFALAVILGIVGLVLWIFAVWNQERP